MIIKLLKPRYQKRQRQKPQPQSHQAAAGKNLIKPQNANQNQPAKEATAPIYIKRKKTAHISH
jgi:hypothetical protein